MNAHALAAEYGLPVTTVRKRLRRGVPLDRPHQVRRGPLNHRLVYVPDPLNALCNAWRTHQPLAALGVRHNLRWRV